MKLTTVKNKKKECDLHLLKKIINTFPVTSYSFIYYVLTAEDQELFLTDSKNCTTSAMLGRLDGVLEMHTRHNLST